MVKTRTKIQQTSNKTAHGWLGWSRNVQVAIANFN